VTELKAKAPHGKKGKWEERMKNRW